jgi:glucokinase
LAISKDLLIDAGGTNLRFALSHDGALADVRVRPTSDFRRLDEALAAEFPSGLPAGVKSAFIGAAAAPKDGRAHLTNADFTIDAAALALKYSGVAFQLLNDVEALAYLLTDAATPSRMIRRGEAGVGGAQVVIAPGTGLGVAFCARHRGQPVIHATEAGHTTAGMPDEELLPLFEILMRGHSRLAIENLLSGPGLVNIKKGLMELAGVRKPIDHSITPREIVAQARVNQSGVDGRAVETFMTLLGSFCGDCALAYYARGGVFLAGSLINAVSDLIATKSFFEAFEKKGRMSDFVAPIPIALLADKEPVLAGLGAYAKGSGAQAPTCKELR